MRTLPDPPEAYTEFTQRFPRLGEAWELLGQAAREGPLGEREVRLIKLGAALGAMREGAVHASVRKAVAEGISREEIEQAVAVVAGTVGMPAAVAVYTWVEDLFD